MDVDPRGRAREAFERGDPAAALAILTPHCERSGDVEDWLTLARLRAYLKQSSAALEAFIRAAKLAPGRIDIARQTARLLLEDGASRDALCVLETAHRANPDDFELATDVAIVCEATGDRRRALDLYDKVIEQSPTAARARLNRAAIAREATDYELALTHYDTLLDIDYDAVVALAGRAECLRLLHRYADCIAACNAALARDPAQLRTAVCKAVAQAMQGDFAAAQAALGKLWLSAPDAVREYAGGDDRPARASVPDARAIYVFAAFERLRQAEWSDYEGIAARCEALFDDAGNAPADLDVAHALLYLSVGNRAASNAHASVANAIHASVPPAAQRSHPARHSESPRIRLGYLSNCFRDHPNTHLCCGLFATHAREHFEVFGYGVNADDGSAVGARVRASFDHYIDVSSATDSDIVARINRDSIDILVDVDGFSDNPRPAVLAARPAPVQVGLMGHIHSHFAPWLDYRVTCAVSEPSEWGRPLLEKRIFLPRGFFPYDTYDNARVPCPPRAMLGLPETGFVFCAFSRVAKICPRVFSIWMALLRDIPDSVLWLNSCEAIAARRLLEQARGHGIAPERLVFAPRVAHAAHLARHAAADLYLDTLIFNAHTTALDALGAGVPMISCPGNSWNSRLGASYLAAFDLAELIADSPQRYQELALELAHDPQRLAALRARLSLQSNPFDAAQIGPLYDIAYRNIWQRRLRGLPPTDIYVT